MGWCPTVVVKPRQLLRIKTLRGVYRDCKMYTEGWYALQYGRRTTLRLWGGPYLHPLGNRSPRTRRRLLRAGIKLFIPITFLHNNAGERVLCTWQISTIIVRACARIFGCSPPRSLLLFFSHIRDRRRRRRQVVTPFACKDHMYTSCYIIVLAFATRTRVHPNRIIRLPHIYIRIL
jgi:hypothetical protein